MTVSGTMRALDQEMAAVRVEDVYETGIDDLWAACTEPERLARWMAEVSGDPRDGSVQASFTSGWSGVVSIEVCEPPSHLLLTLGTEEDGATQVEAWLSEHDGRTRLVVEERGLPLASVHFHGAGWQAHLEDLARSLAGDESVWKARWTELTPVYEGRRP
jgi:uncharacterized protein YndB with AHSA1/START domain